MCSTHWLGVWRQIFIMRKTIYNIYIQVSGLSWSEPHLWKKHTKKKRERERRERERKREKEKRERERERRKRLKTRK